MGNSNHSTTHTEIKESLSIPSRIFQDQRQSREKESKEWISFLHTEWCSKRG